MKLADLRRGYTREGLDESAAHPDAIEQFRSWMQQAVTAKVADATAMVVATASRTGRPSARYVLLKGFDERGFVFYTNHGSRKASDLESNPEAELVFYWPELDRQVRVHGPVARVSRPESEEYFATRPRGSQLGAWASRQSTVVAGRSTLDQALENVHLQFDGVAVPLPEFWGGYRVAPEAIEFWQGRANRMHDRLLYTLDSGAWRMERLAP